MSGVAAMAAAVGALLAVPVGLAVVGSDVAAYASATSAYAACAPATGPVGDLGPDQAGNARTIVRTGQQYRVPEFGLLVALATAMQESGLRAIDHGHLDSLGLFQQRQPWGSSDDRLDPARSAAMFYSGGSTEPDGWEEPGLLDITGWQAMTLSQAAQAVQRSAYPDAYAKWEDDAKEWLAQILGPSAPSYEGRSDPAAEAVLGCTVDGDPIVGDVAALRARAAAFVDAIAAGQPDPFYGALHYYRLCARLAARMHGRAHSGYASAIVQWRAYVTAGLAHVGDPYPPPGALVFWHTPTDGHVAVYLGDGEVVTNDLYDSATGLHGGVYIAPMDDITAGSWALPYLGWAPPVYL